MIRAQFNYRYPSADIHSNRPKNKLNVVPTKHANSHYGPQDHQPNKSNNNRNFYDINGIIVDRSDGHISHDIAELLPNRSECGANIQFDNRIFGGSATSLWEFPWYLDIFVWFNVDRGGQLIYLTPSLTLPLSAVGCRAPSLIFSVCILSGT